VSDSFESQLGLPLSHASMPFELPALGARITSPVTGNTYTMGGAIGEGGFGLVFACTDVWENALVAKVIKPNGADFARVESKAFQEIQIARAR
jgi:hypothetical protein